MNKPLLGKVAVVTGGGRGVGRGIALAMAAHGAKVVVNDLGSGTDGSGASQGPAQDVANEIKQMGGEAVPNFDSVASMAGGERIIKTAIDAFGRLDILVTCAGILRDRMFFNMAEEEWDAVIATHLKGTFACVKPASVVFRQQRSGRIITVTSTSGLFGNPGQANYSAAKSGIAGMTRVLALDLGRYGVTANTIAPRAGTRLTLTEDMKKVMEARRARQEKVFAKMGEETDMDMLAPDDVAPFVVYLASDLTSKVNGQAFIVSGASVSWAQPPRPIRTLYKPTGRWTLDELMDILPRTLEMYMTNPAPAQQPAAPQPAPAAKK
ncbi:MAG: SDR family oxidoreductase [Chloroflexi bacterium]|nr:SDR family oxidoreductase [Chloroflexota bacterium]